MRHGETDKVETGGLLRLPSDRSLCKRCGEIFPYRIDICPQCHVECVSLDEYRLENSRGFYGGATVKWFACLFMLALVGLFIFALSRNASDERLLGRRDQLLAEIERLRTEEKVLDEKIDPAREVVAKADAIRKKAAELLDQKRSLEKRERDVEDRENKVKDREGKVEELEVLNEKLGRVASDIEAGQRELKRLKSEIGEAEEDKKKADNLLKEVNDDINRRRQDQTTLAERMKSLSASIAEQSASWTNLTLAVSSFSDEARKLQKLQANCNNAIADLAAARGEYASATNAVAKLVLQRDILKGEQERINHEVQRLQTLTNTLTVAVAAATREVSELDEKKRVLVNEVDLAGRQKDYEAILVGLNEEIDAQKKKLADVGSVVKGFDDAIDAMKADLSAAVAATRKRLGDVADKVEEDGNKQ